MGTPAFAVPALRSLASAHEVVAVFTQPDRPAGRGRQVKRSPVKHFAEEHGLALYQPLTLKGSAVLEDLKELEPDVICVAAYGAILPPAVLDIPACGCLNVHASLLPRHRGAAPVHRAILEGDDVTGISIMMMEEGLDTGPVALRRSVPVGEATVDELTARLAEVGAEALIDVLEMVERGTAVWEPQDHSAATYASKVTHADVALDPGLTVAEAQRRVRASTSSAHSRACIDGRTVTVVRASISPLSTAPGSVLTTKRDLILGFCDGSLRLDEIRPEGRACMEGACFTRGAQISSEASWEACR